MEKIAVLLEKGKPTKAKNALKIWKKNTYQIMSFLDNAPNYLFECVIQKRYKFGWNIFQFLEQSEKVQIAHILVNWKFQH